MLEALRAYAQVAAGLAEPATAKAREAARALLEAGGAAAASGTNVPALAEELLAVARSNRQLVLDLVRAEVGQTVGRLGLVDATAADAMRHRIVALERDVEALEASRTTAPPAAKKAATGTRKAATGRAATKKAPTKKNAPAASTGTKKAATKKAATGRSTAKRATTRRAAPTKRATAASPSGSSS